MNNINYLINNKEEMAHTAGIYYYLIIKAIMQDNLKIKDNLGY